MTSLHRFHGVHDGEIKPAKQLVAQMSTNRLIAFERLGDVKTRRVITSTIILFSSIRAIGRPRHCHFPAPKQRSTVCSMALILALSFSASPPSQGSHLSGLKRFASSPKTSLFLITAHALQHNEVPFGNFIFPQTTLSC